ncbi:MAG: YdcH family protein [Alphaproteobacteria bacterium]|jgi:hypothetical protein|nr:YdcH family protein [Alphaproteobacteria bacterium]MDP7223003.1 YdcH family protein [Alphaproteobacteria bacterium]
MQEGKTGSAALNSHLNTLKKKHLQLKKRISEEQSRPFVDQTSVAALKKEKLVLKEQITHIHETA